MYTRSDFLYTRSDMQYSPLKFERHNTQHTQKFLLLPHIQKYDHIHNCIIFCSCDQCYVLIWLMLECIFAILRLSSYYCHSYCKFTMLLLRNVIFIYCHYRCPINISIKLLQCNFAAMSLQMTQSWLILSHLRNVLFGCRHYHFFMYDG